MRYGAGRSTGFTLIEMMVALALGAILVVPLYIITRGITVQTDNQRMGLEASQRARFGLDVLIRDFRRAGLSVSPNTAIDPLFVNREVSSSHAQYRSAVVHLNRGQAGNDAVLLSGNFLGGKVYDAEATGPDTLTIVNEAAMGEEECEEQFDVNMSFAHIMGPTGKAVDARVASASRTGGVCSVTIDAANDMPVAPIVVFQMGDTVRLAANQTVLYWVEPGDGRNQLVRYYVDYQSASTPSDTCTAAGISDPGSIDLPGDSTVIESSRVVVADYVEDFQVWLRPATCEMAGGLSCDDTGERWTPPHLYSLVDVESEKGGNFVEGLVLPEEAYVLPQDADGDVAGVDHIACEAPSDDIIGAERVRSAIVRLGVRTEMADLTVDFPSFSTANVRVVDRTIAPVPSDAARKEREGAAYKVKSMVTEIMMTNIAARTDLIVPGL